MEEIIEVRLKEDVREWYVFQGGKSICNIYILMKKNKDISFKKLPRKHKEYQENNEDFAIIALITPIIGTEVSNTDISQELYEIIRGPKFLSIIPITKLEVSNTDISQELYEIIRGPKILPIPCYIRKDICEEDNNDNRITKTNSSMDAYNFFVSAKKQCSEEERMKLESFYKYLYSNSRKVKLLYRGEKYDRISQKLGLTKADNEDKMKTMLFMIGEKGKVYQEEYREKIKKENKIYPIDCIEESFIDFIFEKYKKILSKDKKEIREFTNKNRKFADYFKDENNRNDFCEKLKQGNKDEIIKLRDYYLIPLHHLGGMGFYDNSFFVSTSTNFEIAKKFATSGESSSEQIILVSWIEHSFSKIGFSFDIISQKNKKIKELGLPMYCKSFFPKQNEISLKTMFPHYLLGYFKLNANEFVSNPHLFTTEKCFDEIIQEGIDIDQSDFIKEVNKTNYNWFVLFDGDEYTDYNSDLSLNSGWRK
ncbi:MAG: hypothetical protein LBG80_18715 [Bacteroidales bacterium]|jgi:hypothetical protein|nr:hypothetical protein [Bacteroidales bacterium]